MERFDYDIVKDKADFRININIGLLSMGFVVFTFIASFKPELLQNNIFLGAELTLSIPFILSSSLARIKEIKKIRYEKWDKFASVTFIIGYGLLISAIGIMLAVLVSEPLSLLFFSVNILLSLIYSYLEASYNHGNLRNEFKNDLFFLLILLTLGVLPSLGVY